MAGLALMGLSGAFAMAGLGMRHALDPDHVATVDGMAYALLERAPRLAPWVGALFALGHGVVVTAIAVATSLAAREVGWLAAPPAVVEWLPMGLLLLVGTLNLRALLSADEEYRPISLKGRWLPAWLRGGDHPLAILATGVIFALMLDSAAQAAAWGTAAGLSGGAPAALAVGTAFTAGMVLAATAYGHAMTGLLRTAASTARPALYRRRIGWATVAFAYGIVAYAVLTSLVPGAALPEAWLGGLGAAAVGAMGLATGWLWWRGRAGTPAAAPPPSAGGYGYRPGKVSITRAPAPAPAPKPTTRV